MVFTLVVGVNVHTDVVDVRESNVDPTAEDVEVNDGGGTTESRRETMLDGIEDTGVEGGRGKALAVD